MKIDTDSILDTVKKGCQLAPNYDAFDADIIIHINGVFFFLNQLGVGPKEPFQIEDRSDSWDDFTDDPIMQNAVKSYMIMRVKLVFDPPTNGTVMQALRDNIKELEWRLNVQVDPGESEVIQNE